MIPAGDARLTVHLGERERSQGRFAPDALMEAFVAAGIEAAAAIPGSEGFGPKHRRRTDRLLTFSEDPPIVVTGVGESAAVERAALDPVVSGSEAPAVVTPVSTADANERIDLMPSGSVSPWLRASVYLGRGERLAGRPAYEAVVTRLRASGVDAASVVLGVDGILSGRRRRARFLSRNHGVPAIAVAVGHAEAIARGLDSLRALPGERLITVEDVHVCKSGGRMSGSRPASGDGSLRRLTMYSSEDAMAGSRPVHIEAVRRLRAAGAPGATATRGIWGFDGTRPPRGDRILTIRRRVPTITEVIDTADESERWLAILDELTPARGLLTIEAVSVAVAPVSRC